MNVFALNENPELAAQEQCDKHIPKMTVESGQMLSTAHRLLDGVMQLRPSKSGKTKVKYYRLPDNQMEVTLYKNVHGAHPCTIWSMQTSENYKWHYKHFIALCDEYTFRFGKIHKTDIQLRYPLSILPKNIPEGPLTPFPLAMKSNPECMFEDDPIKSYKLFYQTKQSRFKMAWERGREKPDWFQLIA